MNSLTMNIEYNYIFIVACGTLVIEHPNWISKKVETGHDVIQRNVLHCHLPVTDHFYILI